MNHQESQAVSQPNPSDDTFALLSCINETLHRNLALAQADHAHYKATADDLLNVLPAQTVADYFADILRRRVLTPAERLDVALQRQTALEIASQNEAAEVDAEIRDLLDRL